MTIIKMKQKENKLPHILSYKAALLFIFTLLLSCQEEQVPKYLEPELFAKIYAEAVAQSLNSTDQDSLAHLAEALEKYRTTREEFESSIGYYNTNPDLWLEVFNEVVEELKEKKTTENQKL